VASALCYRWLGSATNRGASRLVRPKTPLSEAPARMWGELDQKGHAFLVAPDQVAASDWRKSAPEQFRTLGRTGGGAVLTADAGGTRRSQSIGALAPSVRTRPLSGSQAGTTPPDY